MRTLSYKLLIMLVVQIVVVRKSMLLIGYFSRSVARLALSRSVDPSVVGILSIRAASFNSALLRVVRLVQPVGVGPITVSLKLTSACWMHGAL